MSNLLNITIDDNMLDEIEKGWYLDGTCSCMGGGTKKYAHNKYPGTEIRISRKGTFEIRQIGQAKRKGNQTNFKFIYDIFIQTIPSLD